MTNTSAQQLRQKPQHGLPWQPNMNYMKSLVNTLVAHQSMMQCQQKMCPQAVAVTWDTPFRHKGHFNLFLMPAIGKLVLVSSFSLHKEADNWPLLSVRMLYKEKCDSLDECYQSILSLHLIKGLISTFLYKVNSQLSIYSALIRVC